ncbi:hypothetical protein IWX92DRAFT_36233 [Phyllosticta citricarpa]
MGLTTAITQRNFTANIICRVCGNAGHMARDCPDRQRGANWRNNDRGGRIGAGDHVDREYESLMAELGGGAAPAIGGSGPQHRIEAGPGGYDDQGDRDMKPWQRGPTGAAAPWRQSREERDGGSSAPPWASGGGRGGNDNYGYGAQSGGYGAPAAPGAAPWQQSAAVPPPPGGYGYGYGYGTDPNAAYGQPAMGAPPGLAPPPGMPAMFPGYPVAPGTAGSPPPPPPPGDAPPPPPPSDQPPPPPPPGA